MIRSKYMRATAIGVAFSAFFTDIAQADTDERAHFLDGIAVQNTEDNCYVSGMDNPSSPILDRLRTYIEVDQDALRSRRGYFGQIIDRKMQSMSPMAYCADFNRTTGRGFYSSDDVIRFSFGNPQFGSAPQIVTDVAFTDILAEEQIHAMIGREGEARGINWKDPAHYDLDSYVKAVFLNEAIASTAGIIEMIQLRIENPAYRQGGFTAPDAFLPVINAVTNGFKSSKTIQDVHIDAYNTWLTTPEIKNHYMKTILSNYVQTMLAHEQSGQAVAVASLSQEELDYMAAIPYEGENLYGIADSKNTAYYTYDDTAILFGDLNAETLHNMKRVKAYIAQKGLSPAQADNQSRHTLQP